MLLSNDVIIQHNQFHNDKYNSDKHYYYYYYIYANDNQTVWYGSRFLFIIENPSNE